MNGVYTGWIPFFRSQQMESDLPAYKLKLAFVLMKASKNNCIFCFYSLFNLKSKI